MQQCETLKFLGRGNRGVGVAHGRGGDHAALEDQRRLGGEKRLAPQHDVRQLAGFQRADLVGDAVADGWVDGVFGDRAIAPAANG